MTWAAIVLAAFLILSWLLCLAIWDIEGHKLPTDRPAGLATPAKRIPTQRKASE